MILCLFVPLTSRTYECKGNTNFGINRNHNC
nr:MAG TPA: hypothetical protein [Caudoviricetes sp.]